MPVIAPVPLLTRIKEWRNSPSPDPRVAAVLLEDAETALKDAADAIATLIVQLNAAGKER